MNGPETLVARIEEARAAAERATAELRELRGDYEQRLSSEVERRTEDLQGRLAAKDRFLSIVAHDLRGPLWGLGLLYNDIVRSPDDFNGTVLSLTRGAITNICNLLEQLLMWARNERGETAVSPVHVDLCEMLREVEVLYAAEAAAKGIELKLPLERRCEVYGDVAMVRSVLRNLINNALKFTGCGGSVVVSIETQEGHCRIGIRDTGAGMSDEQRRNLSRPEGRAPQEMTMGLGLVLCRDFIARNGGTLSVESREGEGTTVSFTLPSRPEARADGSSAGLQREAGIRCAPTESPYGYGKSVFPPLAGCGEIRVPKSLLDRQFGGNMNFYEALNAHLDWKHRLRRYIEGATSEYLDAAQVGCDDGCELGRWIREQYPAMKIFPEFIKVREMHADFHRCAAEVVELANSGDTTAALATLEGECAQLSSLVVRAITKLHKALGEGATVDYLSMRETAAAGMA